MSRKHLLILSSLTFLAVISYFVAKPPRNSVTNGDALVAAHHTTDTTDTKPPFSPSLTEQTPAIDRNPVVETPGSLHSDTAQTATIEASRQLHQFPDPQQDLELLSLVLSHYRTRFQEYPLGTENFEFTAALTGSNPQNIHFIAPDSLVVRKDYIDG